MYRIIGQRAKNGIFNGIRNYSNKKDTGTRLTLDQVHQTLMEQGESCFIVVSEVSQN